MKRTVILIILIFTLLNISSFFILGSRTPQGTVFTGAVHYPPDYLYYLSYITQGSEHWVLGENLKSADTQTPELLNWFYVLGGHMGNLLSLSPVATYQWMVVVASIAYIVSAYALFTVCFPKQPTSRLIAFVLFLISNAFPKITHTAAGWDVNFFYPFNNLGHPFVRLSNVPHHTIIQSAIMASFFFAARFWQNRKYVQVGWLVFIGILLSSMQPLQWAFVTGIIGLSGLWISYRQFIQKTERTGTALVVPLIPSITLGIIGLPIALYLRHLYSGPLYTYMLLWEQNQQVHISFYEFILLHGPVMLVAVVSVLFIVRTMYMAVVPLFLYTLISLSLFFSPIPAWLGLLNLRFVSVISIFMAAYLSASSLHRITRSFPVRWRFVSMWFGAFLIVAITIPVTYAHVVLTRPHALPTDLNTYLPTGAYQLYEIAKQRILPTETTLVTPLLAQSFPAFTGRHVFVADAFGTIHFEQKNAQSLQFFSGKDTPEERLTWLHGNNIQFIFTYAWTPIGDLPNLEVVAKNEYAILYKVK